MPWMQPPYMVRLSIFPVQMLEPKLQTCVKAILHQFSKSLTLLLTTAVATVARANMGRSLKRNPITS